MEALCVLNVAVEQGAVTSVDGVVGLLAGFAELVGHGLVALRDTEFANASSSDTEPRQASR